MPEKPTGSMSGLTEEEAKEFHSLFMFGFSVFTAVAAVAHFLVWTWRPWLPSVRGYTCLCDGAVQSVAAVSQQLTPFIG
jgi:light-harvesting complex 1 beta chain